ncbi:MAG: hypothetical protein EOP83_20545 [Verrucomicrobiaceae bacterium]|nr:MAG: hypothetical protein EOP83_20545 [Verrucomicrobiaceae bacterium]
MATKFPFLRFAANRSMEGKPILPFVTGYVAARVDFAPAQEDGVWRELSHYLQMIRRDHLVEANAVIDAVAGKNAKMLFLAYLSNHHYKNWLFVVDACTLNNFKNHGRVEDIGTDPNRDVIAHTRAAEMFEFIMDSSKQPPGYQEDDQTSRMIERAYNVLAAHAPEARFTLARLIKLSDLKVDAVIAQNYWLYSTGVAL